MSGTKIYRISRLQSLHSCLVPSFRSPGGSFRTLFPAEYTSESQSRRMPISPSRSRQRLFASLSRSLSTQPETSSKTSPPDQIGATESKKTANTAVPIPKPSHSSVLPPHRRALPQTFVTDIYRTIAEYTSPSPSSSPAHSDSSPSTVPSTSTTALPSPRAIYTAPPHRSFYAFSYTGSALFVTMASVYATNMSALPHTSLIVRVSSALVVTGSTFLAWFWTSVARKLVKSVEVLPLKTGGSGAERAKPGLDATAAAPAAAAAAGETPLVRITMRKPFFFFPRKVVTLPVDQVRISHRFGAAYMPPSLRSSVVGDEREGGSETGSERSRSGGVFVRTVRACIEDHKLITQPRTMPKLVVKGKEYYLDPRGEFLDDGRAVDRVFKLEQ